MSIGAAPNKPLTDKQGQWRAFIHACSVVMGRAPAEADLQRNFAGSAASVPRLCWLSLRVDGSGASTERRAALSSQSARRCCRSFSQAPRNR